MEVLLIGGLRDGKRISVPEYYLPILKVPVPGGAIEEYWMKKMSTEDGVVKFYVHHSLTTFEAIKRLVEHYKP